ncbi:FixH family protein [Alphaproteobacteria bacterium KMM 3653]|uniref:FixH family protein n=1 Tax=Harenicola maris TaxID=2841044 RepID=A0AAP2CNK5_9RHOB|nr:FixH family protein [Harenicola maris]
MTTTGKPLTGRKVALMFVSGFAVIIAVNLTLAFKAVATFPGLEVKNSYVASQSYDADRAAQENLAWDVAARVEDGILRLTILHHGDPVQPVIRSATLGRATNVAQDQTPEFTFDGQAFTAPVTLGKGNWNLRLVAEAEDGTTFKQRIIVRIAG